MPLYEYKCEKCGELFEVMQKFSDEPLRVHEKCGGLVNRLLSAPALQFKGSGVSASSVQLGADKKTLTITLGAYKAGTQSTSVTSGSPAYQAQSATDTFPVQLPSQPFTDSSSSGF